MYVKRIHRVDAEGKDFTRVFFHLSGRSGKYGHIHVIQFAYVGHYGYVGRNRFSFRGVAAHDASHFKVGCRLKRLKSEMPDVAVSNYGGSDFLHLDE